MAEARSYKDLSEELSRILSDLESGDLDIDEAVRCYERGLAIVRKLEAHLTRAENKVTELKGSVLEDEEE